MNPLFGTAALLLYSHYLICSSLRRARLSWCSPKRRNGDTSRVNE